MTLLLPRIGGPEVDLLLDELLDLEVEEMAARMPVEDIAFTYAPTGGVQAPRELLPRLRDQVLVLARSAGYPGVRSQQSLRDFDADCARLLHDELQTSPHEAGHREVWACVTAAHLLDVAAWRWGGIGDRNRVNGHVNRDTFRRLWWRAEVLHDPEQSWDRFGDLGEDEIVAIMERPGVTGNPLVARAVVRAFLGRLEDEPDLASARMDLMRDAMKRLTRLTPFTMLDVLSADDLRRTLDGVMEEAAVAVSRDPSVVSAG